MRREEQDRFKTRRIVKAHSELTIWIHDLQPST